MRKTLLALALLPVLALSACQGNVRPRVGAEWVAGNEGFVGLGLGEASWGTAPMASNNVRVDLKPAWYLLGALVLTGTAVAAYLLLRKKA
jgi:hypothetical protein